MSSRHPFYLTLVCLLGLLFSLPQILIGFSVATEIINNGWSGLPYISDFRQMYWPGHLSNAAFWNDRFISLGYVGSLNGQLTSKLTQTNPETGETEDVDRAFQLKNDIGIIHSPLSFGERLFFIGTSNSCEIVNGNPHETEMSYPRIWTHGSLFLLNGEPAVLERGGTKLTVSMNTQGLWVQKFEVVLPNNYRERELDGIKVDFQQAWFATCLELDGTTHLLLHMSDGSVIHRNRLELQPISATNVSSTSRPIPNALTSDNTTVSASLIGPVAVEPISALTPVNTDAQLEGWTMLSVPGHLSDTDKRMKYSSNLVVYAWDLNHLAAVDGQLA
ncbi:MAG: hypothetical protein FJ267_11635, partial [Planctomycetes bacterium]|nr:hypothetical protein [Planctomycetota bacterium]